jgi:FtsP/CotA-like multicopper oxidase with cupredoxin domain
MKRLALSLAGSLIAVAALVTLAATAVAEEPALLDPLSLTKYMDPLPIPGVATMAGPNYYEIGAYQIQQQLHSQLSPTTVYGYGTSEATASYPGPTIVVQKGVPIQIKWTNHLPMTHILEYAFDPTIPRAATTTGIPIATHVHGAEVEPESDGGPMTWFTPGFAETGPEFKGEIKHYVNTQLPATIWYHDHAFGYTRHNVYAGLAGYYIVTDPGNEPAGLPAAPYDMGICIQDRMFTAAGQLWYPNEGETSIHPIWVPEFFGNVILVNGKVWPYLNVEPRKYRFRFLNGSQARFYSLALADPVTTAPGPAFYQIGTDGGYLAEPVVLNLPNNPSSPRLVMGPGERCDVIIDFSGYAPGAELLLKNTGKAPAPTGEAANPQTVGQIMLFKVVPSTGPDNSVIPPVLTTVTRLSNPVKTRVMTLNEMQAEGGPIGALLNGMPMDAPITEYPTLGTTEMWEIANLTGDTHPIHIHLVQFQLLDRHKFNARRYQVEFDKANPVLPAQTYVPVPVEPFLKGKPVPADPNERGWKDTFRMNPGEVTRILVRWAPQDESPNFAFDATAEPGYVWHCHILEHEENDMMRPFMLVAPTPMVAQTTPVMGVESSLPSGGAALLAAYPNPSVRGATIQFRLVTAGQADVELYDVTGQRVKTLASQTFAAGEHSLAWAGDDESGRTLTAGVYFVRLRTPETTLVRKLFVAH